MSFEAIELIQAAELQAKITVSEAEAAAKRKVADAKLRAKAAQEAALAKAESEMSELRDKNAAIALEAEKQIMTDANNKAEALISKSDKLIDKAAMLIAERIVNA